MDRQCKNRFDGEDFRQDLLSRYILICIINLFKVFMNCNFNEIHTIGYQNSCQAARSLIFSTDIQTLTRFYSLSIGHIKFQVCFYFHFAVSSTTYLSWPDCAIYAKNVAFNWTWKVITKPRDCIIYTNTWYSGHAYSTSMLLTWLAYVHVFPELFPFSNPSFIPSKIFVFSKRDIYGRISEFVVFHL